MLVKRFRVANLLTGRWIGRFRFPGRPQTEFSPEEHEPLPDASEPPLEFERSPVRGRNEAVLAGRA